MIVISDFQQSVGIKVDGKCLDVCQKALKKAVALDDPKGPPGAAPSSPPTMSELQRDLKKLGFYTGPIDGRVDQQVTDAVKSFQSDAGIPADGKCVKRCQLAFVRALTKS
jgi:peptidoglycan hydrolase-like protein with peptidoglycan-binding domain